MLFYEYFKCQEASCSFHIPCIQQSAPKQSSNPEIFSTFLHQRIQIQFVRIPCKILNRINIYAVINADSDNLCNLYRSNGKDFVPDEALFIFKLFSQYLLSETELIIYKYNSTLRSI